MRLALGAAIVFSLLLPMAGSGGSTRDGGERTATLTWDYVALGDSLPYGAGDVAGKSFVITYAHFIRQDTGASVSVHNLATDGGTSGDLLVQLRYNTQVRHALKGAEVVTISIGGNDLDSHLGDYAAKTCGGPDNQKCFRAGLAAFKRTWPAVLNEILRLRNRDTTIIRVTNDYNPFPGNSGAAANLGRSIAKDFTPLSSTAECVPLLHGRTEGHPMRGCGQSV